MNRLDFQQIAWMRLKESRALLAAGFPEGAYYLAGYAVECALKACIAQRMREHEFPERDSHKYYKHELGELFVHALLKKELESAMQLDPALEQSWNILKNWSEEARYERGKTIREAQDLIEAIDGARGGIFAWLQQRW